jgi:hypothetical protein
MSNIHTPSEQVKTTPGFANPITAATNNGAGVDAQSFENAKAIFNSAPSGAGTTSDCKLQESDDNAAWVDVAGATFAQVSTAGGAKIQVMDIKLSNRKRYLRLVHTGAGGSAAGVAYGLIELYNARYNPVSQINPAISV